MGLLRDFDLTLYGCDLYMETGTGMGVSLSKAIDHFAQCYSADLDQEMIDLAKVQFPKAHFYHGLSTDALKAWLQQDFDPKSRILFYLDAHFPNADFRGARYDVHAPHAVPLQEELGLIAKYRAGKSDFIICDDARIYHIGPFEHGNVEALQVPGGMQFIYDLFPDSDITLDYREEGYILISNKSNTFDVVAGEVGDQAK